jgi:hypothetical protein
MHVATWFVNRARCRNQCLTGNLSTECSLTIFIWRLPAKNIDLNCLEVEQGDKVLKGRSHASMLPVKRPRIELL